MVTKHPRPNQYLSSSELSQRLVRNAMHPRPKPMGRVRSWWSDLIDCDKLYWGFVIGIFACAVIAYVTVPAWLEWGR